jgi:hypothetical protein
MMGPTQGWKELPPHKVFPSRQSHEMQRNASEVQTYRVLTRQQLIVYCIQWIHFQGSRSSFKKASR